MFRRLTSRLRGKKKEEPKVESTPDAPPAKHEAFLAPRETTPPEEVEVGPGEPFTAPRETPRVGKREPLPTGTLVASSATTELRIDEEATSNIARAARIRPQSVAEIVAGEDLKRDEEGRIHIKIVFYGPSLSGKTTALRWLFANVRALAKGKIVEISDELGRTTYFDFIPVSAGEKVIFDVFTVAGQRRHATQRINVLRGVDGMIFMADSTPEQMNENLASIQELRIALGTDRMGTLPIVVSLNKRDLPNALPVDRMLQMLDLEGYPVFATIATEGKNLLRMFQRILRDSLIFKVGV
ncbi:MAG: ADP-ribosylation factor-like protein [Candidatus Thorarchaeota archaeon]